MDRTPYLGQTLDRSSYTYRGYLTWGEEYEKASIASSFVTILCSWWS